MTGTSAEAGDDGEAGRGNRANGLITPHRPMTLESVAGKNPVTHVGKLYNLAAGLIAEDVVARVPEVEEAHCLLVSQIGRPIEEPWIAELAVACAGIGADEVAPRVRDVAREGLARVPQLADELVEGRLGVDRWPFRT